MQLGHQPQGERYVRITRHQIGDQRLAALRLADGEGVLQSLEAATAHRAPVVPLPVVPLPVVPLPVVPLPVSPRPVAAD